MVPVRPAIPPQELIINPPNSAHPLEPLVGTFSPFAMDHNHIVFICFHPCVHIFAEVHQITTRQHNYDKQTQKCFHFRFIHVRFSTSSVPVKARELTCCRLLANLRKSWDIVVVDEHPLNLVMEVARVILPLSCR